MAAALWLPALTGESSAQIVYSGELGTSMAVQGWAYQASTVPEGNTPTATAGFSGGATVANTTSTTTDRAGWAYGRYIAPSFPILDRSVGFTVSIDLAVHQEEHSNDNRAGFSWTTMGSDGFGVEFGFHGNSVWAQGTTPTVFTRAETAATDTSIRDTYTLSVTGAAYTLSNSGGTLLTGSLRNYATAGAPTIPYAAFQNYLFLGDNTAAAAASYSIYAVAVAVPEPDRAAILVGAIAIPAVWLLKRTRR
jgi:hypothetical protein